MPCLLRAEYGCLSAPRNVPRSSHGRRRIHCDHLADDEPIEEHPNGGEMLFNSRGRVRLLASLYIYGHGNRLQIGKAEPTAFAPREELPHSPRVREARVPVPNICREELTDVRSITLISNKGDKGAYGEGATDLINTFYWIGGVLNR